jgi:hypothetical protein
VVLSCGDYPSVALAGPAEPHIAILLVTHTDSQVANVQYTTPADSVVVLVPRPIADDSVVLVVRSSDGTESALTPLPGDSGLYGFTLAVVPGETYSLAGTVLGRPIQARTTVPGTLVVREPPGDTLRLSAPRAEQLDRFGVPYAWHAEGAVAYRLVAAGLTTARTFGGLFRDTSGTLSIIHLAGNPIHPESTLLRVLALDSAAGNVRRNISGALGTFGSASVLDPPKLLLWQ